MLSTGNNSFDLLRLGAALLVILSHSFLLAGTEPLQALNQQLSIGRLGLAIFFILSGYLVAQSWQRDPAFYRYLARRLLRLIPALAGAAILTAFVFGLLLTALSAKNYLLAVETWMYPVKTTLLLTIDQSLPGVLANQPYPQNQINAPLWTLPLEMIAYLLLPLALKIGGKLSWPAAVVGWLAIIGAYSWLLSPEIFPTLSGQTFWLLLLFSLGVSLNSNQSIWTLGRWPLLAAGLLASGLILTPLGPLGLTLLALILIIFAERNTVGQEFVARYGDLSYGFYILAFPIQQLLVAGFPGIWPVVLFIVAVVLTFPLAALSWRFIESRALSYKPRRPASESAG